MSVDFTAFDAQVTGTAGTAGSASGNLDGGDGGLQDRLEFAALMKLMNDVAAADEFSVNIDLGNGRPV